MAELIGIGAAVYDTLLLCDRYPTQDTKHRVLDMVRQGGGQCSTALATAARLGVSARFLGSVGDDEAGHAIANDLEQCGVDVSALMFAPAASSTQSFVVLARDAATRTCIWHKGTMPDTQPEQISEADIAASRVLHLDGHYLPASLYAAKLAQKHGVPVCMDAGGLYPGVETLLPYVDYMIASQEFALHVSGRSDPQEAAFALMEHYEPALVIVTQGAKGGLFLEKGGALRHYPAYPVAVVDTNGAGDAYHGAFLAGWLRGMGHYQAACFASAVSALKCTGLGARRHLPTFSKALDFLEQMEAKGY